MRSILNIFSVIVLFLFTGLILALSWDMVSTAEIDQQTAALVFTAATVQIGIAITVIKHSWDSFYKLTSNIPAGRSRLGLIDYRGIKNKDKKYKYNLISAYGFGNIFIGLSIFLNLLSLIGIVGIMLEYKTDLYTITDYQWSLFVSFWSLTLFVTGMIAVGFAYVMEILSYIWGKSTFIFKNVDSSAKSNNADVDIEH